MFGLADITTCMWNGNYLKVEGGARQRGQFFCLPSQLLLGSELTQQRLVKGGWRQYCSPRWTGLFFLSWSSPLGPAMLQPAMILLYRIKITGQLEIGVTWTMTGVDSPPESSPWCAASPEASSSNWALKHGPKQGRVIIFINILVLS